MLDPSKIVRTFEPNATRKFNRVALIDEQTGIATAYHVTSHVDELIEHLKSGRSLMLNEEQDPFELGRGLYVCSSPHIWQNRAFAKWDFLVNLDQKKFKALVDSLTREVARQRHIGRITISELAFAADLLSNVLRKAVSLSGLVLLAQQPYSIAFWKKEWLAPLGIGPGKPPRAAEVAFIGSFYDANAGIDLKAAQAVADGAFIQSYPPQLVIWNRKAILRFREVNPW